MSSGRPRKSYFDESSFSSTDGSSLSSFSASGSGSTWSLPRSRVASNRTRSGAPRRSGSSFRVSLRPSRHARHNSVSSSAGGSGNTVFDVCCGEDGARYTVLKRRVWTILLGFIAISAVFSTSQPEWSFLQYVPDTLDDLVAQGEMSAHANEEGLDMAIRSQHLELTSITDTTRDGGGLRGQDENAASFEMGQTSPVQEEHTVVNENGNAVDEPLHQQASPGAEEGATTAIAIDEVNENGNADVVDESVQQQVSPGSGEGTTTATALDEVNENGNVIDEPVEQQVSPGTDESITTPIATEITVTDSMNQEAIDGVASNNASSVYEQIYKNQKPVDLDTSDGLTAALRQPRLRVVNEEDRLPAKNDVDANLDPFNYSTPDRLDWTPRVKNRTDALNSTVVAYLLPIYQCYRPPGQVSLYGLHEPANDHEFHDAALMLQASIHKNSVRNPSSGSSYDYEMVALVHRGIQSCDGGGNRTTILENLGYRVEVVREPVHANNVQNDYLRKHAPRNNGGRAGMREMIRLYAFKMVEYRINVLVDITSFMLHPADSIYDALLNGPRGHEWAETHPNHIVRDTFYPNGTVISPPQLPTELDIMFTRDYSAMDSNSWTTGMSLSFVPVRPSLDLYKQLVNTYKTTQYDKKNGWDNKGYVNYRGSMQTKGLLTYYFSEVHPDHKLELHRCVYNNMADVPFVAGKTGGTDSCKDIKEHQALPDGQGNMPCTDCRKQLFDEIVMANYGICQSPWACPYIVDTGRVPLLVPTLTMCRAFHSAWFELRKMVEERVVDESKRAKTTGTFHPELFNGYCLPGGERGGSYVQMDRTISLPEGLGNVQF